MVRLFKLNRRHFSAWALALWATQGMALAQPNPTSAVLVLGDSLSAEYGLQPGTGWVAQLKQKLAQAGHRSTRVVNASISGETTSGGRSRLPGLLAQHQPAVVVIALGANDGLRGLPLASAQDNLAYMSRAARQAGAGVLLLGMQIPPNYGAKYSQQFEQMFAQVARAEKTALVPFFLKNVADVPHASTLFQPDRLHPNEAAQAIMLANVWPALRKLLPKP